ncbi:MAG: Maf family protein, partial [Lentimicrobiaceae bacterium]
FEVLVKPIVEIFPANLKAEEIALYVSKEKAMVFDLNELPDKSLIITADTIVWFDDKKFGKPLSHTEAKTMLQKLSGRKHVVSTGVCFRTIDRLHTFYVNTDVYFRNLEEDEIDYYIDTFKPYDKAGAYGIQEWIGYVGVERIDGSYFNVMGLPVQRVYAELQKFINHQGA